MTHKEFDKIKENHDVGVYYILTNDNKPYLTNRLDGVIFDGEYLIFNTEDFSYLITLGYYNDYSKLPLPFKGIIKQEIKIHRKYIRRIRKLIF